MQIFMEGRGEKDFAPDQIKASVTFHYHANTYDEALHGGVDKVKITLMELPVQPILLLMILRQEHIR